MGRGPKPKRQFIQLREAAYQPLQSGRAVFLDRKGQTKRTYDFIQKGFSRGLARPLAWAFQEKNTVLSDRTLDAKWSCFESFVEFCHEKRIAKLADLNSERVHQFKLYLDDRPSRTGKPLSMVRKAQCFQVVTELLLFLKTSGYQELSNLTVPLAAFPNKKNSGKPVQPLTRQSADQIFSWSYDLAVQARERIRQGQRILEGSEPEPVPDLRQALIKVKDRYGSVVPDAKTLRLNREVCVQNVIKELGHVSRLQSYLGATFEGISAAYICLLIKTAANPEGFGNLSLQDEIALPLTKGKRVLAWNKTRSTRAQTQPYSIGKPRGIASLLSLTREITAALRPSAPPYLADKIFIFRGFNGNCADYIALLKPQSVRGHFLYPRIQDGRLPKFNLQQLRTTALSGAYQVTGDVRIVQKIANHASARTTGRYLHNAIGQTVNTSVMVPILNELSEYYKSDSDRTEKVHPGGKEEEAATDKTMASAFGFTCLDPFAGVAPGTKEGELCTQFLECFACPNSVLLLDEETAIKVLKALKALEECRSRIDPIRWKALYEPKYRILRDQVLPEFGEQTLNQALRHKEGWPDLPPLI